MTETWTPEREERLRELWAAGKTATEIAAAIGDPVTRNAVIGKAHRLGLEGRDSPIRREPQIGRTDEAGRRRDILLGDVDRDGCRFATGAHERLHLFCNAPSIPGQSWCEEHRARVFDRAGMSERKMDWIARSA